MIFKKSFTLLVATGTTSFFVVVPIISGNHCSYNFKHKHKSVNKNGRACIARDCYSLLPGLVAFFRRSRTMVGDIYLGIYSAPPNKNMHTGDPEVHAKNDIIGDV